LTPGRSRSGLLKKPKAGGERQGPPDPVLLGIIDAQFAKFLEFEDG
jgi:hypothetical protein